MSSSSSGGSKEAKYLVGFHVSSFRGVLPDVETAVKCGAKAIAFFTRSKNCPPLKAEDASKFQSLCAQHNFSPDCILPHGSYLINLGSGNPAMRTKSIAAMVAEVSRTRQLGLTMYNFHPGAATGGSKSESIAYVAEGINTVHASPGCEGVTLVIENMTGQGNVLGSTLEEIGEIINGVTDKSRIGVCIDTAHAHGAGIEIRTPQAVTALLDRLHSVIGMQYLKGMHLNDSCALLGSKRDLHQNIGRGHIGLECFRGIMNEGRLKGVPLILETPIGPNEDTGIYRDEIALLYSLIGTRQGDAAVLPVLADPTAKKGGAPLAVPLSFKPNMDVDGTVSAGGSAKGGTGGRKRKAREEEEGEAEEGGTDSDCGEEEPRPEPKGKSKSKAKKTGMETAEREERTRTGPTGPVVKPQTATTQQTTSDTTRRGKPTLSDPPLGLSVERYRAEIAGHWWS